MRRENFRCAKVAQMVVKNAHAPRFLRPAKRCDILEACRDEASVSVFARSMRAVARLNQATKRQRASRPNPKHFRSQIFHAEAHISAQSPQPFEDTRLPQPYEDEERRRSAVAEARQRAQACFRQRGFSRLTSFPSVSRSVQAAGLDHRSPATPESAKEWRDAGGKIRLAERPSAKTRGLPARVSGEPKVFVDIDELLFSRTIE